MVSGPPIGRIRPVANSNPVTLLSQTYLFNGNLDVFKKCSQCKMALALGEMEGTLPVLPSPLAFSKLKRVEQDRGSGPGALQHDALVDRARLQR